MLTSAFRMTQQSHKQVHFQTRLENIRTILKHYSQFWDKIRWKKKDFCNKARRARISLWFCCYSRLAYDTYSVSSKCSPPFILYSKFVISSVPGYHHLTKVSPWAVASFPISKSVQPGHCYRRLHVKYPCCLPSAPFGFLIGGKNGVFRAFIQQLSVA